MVSPGPDVASSADALSGGMGVGVAAPSASASSALPLYARRAQLHAMPPSTILIMPDIFTTQINTPPSAASSLSSASHTNTGGAITTPTRTKGHHARARSSLIASAAAANSGIAMHTAQSATPIAGHTHHHRRNSSGELSFPSFASLFPPGSSVAERRRTAMGHHSRENSRTFGGTGGSLSSASGATSAHMNAISALAGNMNASERATVASPDGHQRNISESAALSVPGSGIHGRHLSIGLHSDTSSPSHSKNPSIGSMVGIGPHSSGSLAPPMATHARSKSEGINEAHHHANAIGGFGPAGKDGSRINTPAPSNTAAVGSSSTTSSAIVSPNGSEPTSLFFQTPDQHARSLLSSRDSLSSPHPFLPSDGVRTSIDSPVDTNFGLLSALRQEQKRQQRQIEEELAASEESQEEEEEEGEEEDEDETTNLRQATHRQAIHIRGKSAESGVSDLNGVTDVVGLDVDDDDIDLPLLSDDRSTIHHWPSHLPKFTSHAGVSPEAHCLHILRTKPNKRSAMDLATLSCWLGQRSLTGNLFAGLTRRELALLALRVTYEKVPVSTFIMREGQESDRVYLLLTGMVSVWERAGSAAAMANMSLQAASMRAAKDGIAIGRRASLETDSHTVASQVHSGDHASAANQLQSDLPLEVVRDTMQLIRQHDEFGGYGGSRGTKYLNLIYVGGGLATSHAHNNNLYASSQSSSKDQWKLKLAPFAVEADNPYSDPGASSTSASMPSPNVRSNAEYLQSVSGDMGWLHQFIDGSIGPDSPEHTSPPTRQESQNNSPTKGETEQTNGTNDLTQAPDVSLIQPLTDKDLLSQPLLSSSGRPHAPVLGLHGVLFHTRRAASIVTEDLCEFLVLPRWIIERISLKDRLVQQIVRKVAILRQSFPLFHSPKTPVADRFLLRLMHYFSITRVSGGTCLAREGDKLTHAFFIVEGEVELRITQAGLYKANTNNKLTSAGNTTNGNPDRPSHHPPPPHDLGVSHPLHTFGSGEFFNVESAFVFHSSKEHELLNAFSAYARSSTVCILRIKPSHIRQFMKDSLLNEMKVIAKQKKAALQTRMASLRDSLSRQESLLATGVGGGLTRKGALNLTIGGSSSLAPSGSVGLTPDSLTTVLLLSQTSGSSRESHESRMPGSNRDAPPSSLHATNSMNLIHPLLPKRTRNGVARNVRRIQAKPLPKEFQRSRDKEVEIFYKSDPREDMIKDRSDDGTHADSSQTKQSHPLLSHPLLPALFASSAASTLAANPSGSASSTATSSTSLASSPLGAVIPSLLLPVLMPATSNSISLGFDNRAGGGRTVGGLTRLASELLDVTPSGATAKRLVGHRNGADAITPIHPLLEPTPMLSSAQLRPRELPFELVGARPLPDSHWTSAAAAAAVAAAAEVYSTRRGSGDPEVSPSALASLFDAGRRKSARRDEEPDAYGGVDPTGVLQLNPLSSVGASFRARHAFGPLKAPSKSIGRRLDAAHGVPGGAKLHQRRKKQAQLQGDAATVAAHIFKQIRASKSLAAISNGGDRIAPSTARRQRSRPGGGVGGATGAHTDRAPSNNDDSSAAYLALSASLSREEAWRTPRERWGRAIVDEPHIAQTNTNSIAMAVATGGAPLPTTMQQMLRRQNSVVHGGGVGGIGPTIIQPLTPQAVFQNPFLLTGHLLSPIDAGGVAGGLPSPHAKGVDLLPSGSNPSPKASSSSASSTSRSLLLFPSSHDFQSIAQTNHLTRSLVKTMTQVAVDKMRETHAQREKEIIEEEEAAGTAANDDEPAVAQSTNPAAASHSSPTHALHPLSSHASRPPTRASLQPPSIPAPILALLNDSVTEADKADLEELRELQDESALRERPFVSNSIDPREQNAFYSPKHHLRRVGSRPPTSLASPASRTLHSPMGASPGLIKKVSFSGYNFNHPSPNGAATAGHNIPSPVSRSRSLHIRSPDDSAIGDISESSPTHRPSFERPLSFVAPANLSRQPTTSGGSSPTHADKVAAAAVPHATKRIEEEGKEGNTDNKQDSNAEGPWQVERVEPSPPMSMSASLVDLVDRLHQHIQSPSEKDYVGESKSTDDPPKPSAPAPTTEYAGNVSLEFEEEWVPRTGGAAGVGIGITGDGSSSMAELSRRLRLKASNGASPTATSDNNDHTDPLSVLSSDASLALLQRSSAARASRAALTGVASTRHLMPSSLAGTASTQPRCYHWDSMNFGGPSIPANTATAVAASPSPPNTRRVGARAAGLLGAARSHALQQQHSSNRSTQPSSHAPSMPSRKRDSLVSPPSSRAPRGHELDAKSKPAMSENEAARRFFRLGFPAKGNIYY